MGAAWAKEMRDENQPDTVSEGLVDGTIVERCGTEQKCHAAVVALRWPGGFVGPDCGETRHCVFERKGLTYWQRSACRDQATVMCGTIFEATMLPLTMWFLTMKPITPSEEQRLGPRTQAPSGKRYKTAWLLKHRLMEVMSERESARKTRRRTGILSNGSEI